MLKDQGYTGKHGGYPGGTPETALFYRKRHKTARINGETEHKSSLFYTKPLPIQYRKATQLETLSKYYDIKQSYQTTYIYENNPFNSPLQHII